MVPSLLHEALVSYQIAPKPGSHTHTQFTRSASNLSKQRTSSLVKQKEILLHTASISWMDTSVDTASASALEDYVNSNVREFFEMLGNGEAGSGALQLL